MFRQMPNSSAYFVTIFLVRTLDPDICTKKKEKPLKCFCVRTFRDFL